MPHSSQAEDRAAETATAWFLYVVRCADDSLYTGITTDVARRVEEHNAGPRGARYTRAHRPVKLARSWDFQDQSAAARAEHAFKALSRHQKIAVLDGRVAPPWDRQELRS